ncbi:MAG: TIGR04283 family arsenosugar biosynthesis glycosyltransferase [Pseudomonadota bacterium]|uniref:TIGR04283 family arsenosugar biosynthesis glycosyltransferase n=1 Tax=Roseovarius TaxID=74030 RepID=UPI0022A8306C|nr:TIGR04283 family arsenosugar biosynthesis glycosyltransferase [Roseovarius sp. EGI FJ00037]MCZ0811812.1 TIGR04283 family arsenosugar biosynthesis glycosyltransferase [Roseovarius sp. EGI FJ00037]
MRAELSIVIPTLDAAEGLAHSLPALAEGLQEGLIRELIISDGGSLDATLRIAEEAGALVVTGCASRGGQLGRGAEAAGGAWLLFLHADTVLPGGWAELVRAQMEEGRPAFFGLQFDAAGFAPACVAVWANLRSWLFHLPYGDQGLLISRSEYDAVGGYPDIVLMEDVAIARALGRRLQRLPGKVTTSAARYRRAGWLRRGARNIVLLMRYLMGARPEDLARRY